MSSSAADAAAHLALYLEDLIFRQSISSSDNLSAITVSSNVKLDNVEVLTSSAIDELWAQKKSVIFETMSPYYIVVLGIEPSPLASAEELITFQLPQLQGILENIQDGSNEIFGKIPKLKIPHYMWIYLWLSSQCDSTLSYVFAL
jgi:hypothetical protein